MTANPNRRWFQFSLRTLLVLMLVSSCGMGWVAHHLRLARNCQRAIAECDQAGVYVYQYEPTAVGRALRQWPSLDKWVRVQFGDSLLCSPSAVSALRIQEDRVEFLESRLKLFPSLKSVSIGSAEEETVASIRKALPNVDIELGFYK